MPTKKQIITITVLRPLAIGIDYRCRMPKVGSSGKDMEDTETPKARRNLRQGPEFLKHGLVAYYPFNSNAKD